MTDKLTNESRKEVAILYQLRDEIRLQIHLAGMEARDAWTKLEPELQGVEKALAEAEEASRSLLKDLGVRFRAFRDSLVKAREARSTKSNGSRREGRDQAAK